MRSSKNSARVASHTTVKEPFGSKRLPVGLDQDRVIVKRTGEPTYRLPDIAYHREKFRRGFQLLVDIFGADHIATIADVLAGVKALGYDTDKVKVIIHQMVSFVDKDEVVKMSKRSAKVYTLDELVDEVGTDAVHFSLVMRSANTHLEFDVALAKEQSEQNPVYYLQYAHARIASILRFAADQGMPVDDLQLLLSTCPFELIKEKEEIDLLKLLLEFPEVILNCAAAYEPHRLTTYLREVAEAFHRFYHQHRVIGDNRELMKARLAVCQMARIVIANGARLWAHRPRKCELILSLIVSIFHPHFHFKRNNFPSKLLRFFSVILF